MSYYQSEAELDRLEREYDDKCFRDYFKEEADEEPEEEENFYQLWGSYANGDKVLLEETDDAELAYSWEEDGPTEEDIEEGIVEIWVEEARFA